jgi:hypothetical protein
MPPFCGESEKSGYLREDNRKARAFRYRMARHRKLFVALGGEISEGSGSRVRVYLNGVRAVFHRPHPQKETDKGAVKSVRNFLESAGV